MLVSPWFKLKLWATSDVGEERSFHPSGSMWRRSSSMFRGIMVAPIVGIVRRLPRGGLETGNAQAVARSLVVDRCSRAFRISW